MAKRYLFLYLIILILLAGCAQNTIFSGESENWQVILEVIHHNEDFQEEVFYLEYKGDPGEVGKLGYTVEHVVGSFGQTGTTLNEHGVLEGRSECSGCAFTREDMEVTVTVQWNNQSETFQLGVE